MSGGSSSVLSPSGMMTTSTNSAPQPQQPPPLDNANNHQGATGGELLFFDTFSHEVVEELNLDLVQFPSPVIVEEVRVIPLGARVQANFPGGVRLGATNPTRFKLEFFVNDLGKPGAATFESLGVLQYNQSQQIHLHTSRVIPTDGLVLKGMYNAITLAVYGTLSKSTAEQLALAGSSNSNTNTHAVAAAPAAVAANTTSSPTPSRPTPVPTPNLDVPPPNLQPPPHHPSHPPHAHSNHNATAAPPAAYVISPPKPNHHSDHPRGGSGPWPPPDPPHRSSRHSPNWDAAHHPQPRRPVNGSSSGGGHDRRSRSPLDGRDSRRASSSSATHEPSSSSNNHHSNNATVPAAAAAPPPAEGSPVRVKQEPAEDLKDELMDDISDISDGDIPDVPDEEEEEVKNAETTEEALPIKMETDEDAVPSASAEEKAPAPVSEVPPVEAAAVLPPQAVSTERKSLSHSPGDQMLGGIPADDLMEEISDEEAEWSDGEGVPGTGDFEFGEDWEDPIRAYDVYSVDLEGLPDDPCDPVGNEEFVSSLESTLKKMADSDVNSDWIEELEQWTKVLQAEVNSLPTAFVKLHLPDLLKVVNRCLDLEIALSHNVPTLKVRHIHQGLRFVKTAFNVSDHLAKAMILSGLQRKLMDFLKESNIAPTICVTAVQILDLTVNTKMGFDIFTGQNDLNHYRTLNKSEVFSADLNKSENTIHSTQNAATMYLGLCKLGKSLGPCIKPSLCAIMSKISFLSSICNLRSEVDINAEKEASKDFSDSATHILGEVLDQFQWARVSLAQPIKLLPSRFRFQPSSRTAYYDPYPGIFAFLSEVGFLNVLLALLTYPAKSVSLSNTCCLFLDAIISHSSQSQAGLLFLRKNQKSTNSLIRYLVQASSSTIIPNAAGGEDAEHQQQQQPSETKDQDHRLALKLAFSVHAYGVWKKVKDCLGRTKLDDYNKPSVVEDLQVLFSMTYTPAGRLAVASVLSTEDNVSLLIRLIKDSLKPCAENENMTIRPAMRGYACDMIKLVLRTSEDVFCLRNVAPAVTDLANEEEVTRINEAVAWTRPLVQYPTFSADDIPKICEIVSKSLENLCPMSLELVTAVRMLAYFISPEHESEHMIHKQYSLINMYSSGIMETFKELLSKIYSQHEQPQLHTATFVGHSGYLLLSVLKPVVNIMKNILQYLIACRDIEFQDFSHIQILLKIYSLASVVSSGSICYGLSEKVKSDIMLILAAYTSPEFDLSSHASAKTSLWTQMLRELITFTRSLPHFYCHGLRVFMQLLPLPLPILSKGELSEDEQVQITNSRKLWSTHLYPLDGDIKAMVDQFVGITDQNLSNLLKSVVIQLTDLSPLVSKMICNSILDSLSSSVIAPSSDVGGGGGAAASEFDLDKCSNNGPFLRTLVFLSGIMEYSCIKTTVMHLLDSPERKQFLTNLSTLSKSCAAANDQPGSSSSSSSLLFLCQEYIGTIFQTLCDPEITLVNSDTFTEEQLANSIPSRDILEVIVPSLLDQMLNSKHKHPNSVAANVRTISLLLEHDLGFSLIKQGLEQTPRKLGELIDKLASLPETPSFLTITAACLEVITLLSEIPSEQPLYVKPRTLSMTGLQLKTVLNSEKVEEDTWKILKERVNSTEVPLADSENPSDGPEMDQVVHQQIEVLEAQHEKLSELSNEVSTTEEEEPVLIFPAANTLLELFSQREIFSVNCLEDKLTKSYWLSDIDPATAAAAAAAMTSEDTPPSSCDNVNGSHVALTTNQIDLIEVSNVSLQKDFDLIAELRQVCEEKTLETDKQVKKVKKKSAMERKAMQNKNIISNFKAGGSVALRGRGFARPGQRPDGFRSRPPNTSRPPSLHVDDFVLLQQRGQQPTGPTGYNKQSIKAAKELFAQREAQHGMKGPGVPASAVGFREATKVPVFLQGRDNGPMGVGGIMPVGLRGPPPRNGPRDHGNKSSGGGPMYRGGGGNNARGGGRPRGWSPSNGDDRRFNTGRRGPPQGGGGWGDNRRGGGGGGRDRRRFGGGGGGREDSRPRHIRSNMTR